MNCTQAPQCTGDDLAEPTAAALACAILWKDLIYTRFYHKAEKTSPKNTSCQLTALFNMATGNGTRSIRACLCCRAETVNKTFGAAKQANV